MQIATKLLGPMVLGLAMMAPALTTGCAARVGYYDSYHRDYHHWDHDEDDHYRSWLHERHYEYRDFRRLDPDQQRDYWKWRHDHDHDR
ncbi:MAG TPA: hypothetical protein VJN93_07485 [Candidatus Acidoferrum sp.]|nr:hypothetical protein [Candidatus Acidoferrum sp.]